MCDQTRRRQTKQTKTTQIGSHHTGWFSDSNIANVGAQEAPSGPLLHGCIPHHGLPLPSPREWAATVDDTTWTSGRARQKRGADRTSRKGLTLHSLTQAAISLGFHPPLLDTSDSPMHPTLPTDRGPHKRVEHVFILLCPPTHFLSLLIKTDDNLVICAHENKFLVLYVKYWFVVRHNRDLVSSMICSRRIIVIYQPIIMCYSQVPNCRVGLSSICRAARS